MPIELDAPTTTMLPSNVSDDSIRHSNEVTYPRPVLASTAPAQLVAAPACHMVAASILLDPRLALLAFPGVLNRPQTIS